MKKWLPSRGDGTLDSIPEVTTSSMQAAVWRGSEDVQLEQRPWPVCPPGWVLVKPALVGLCGTDLTIHAGRHGRATPPLVLGHEIVANVVEPTESGLSAGTLVAVQPTMSCNDCWPCRNGFAHTCRRLQLIGIDVDGGLAEAVAVPLTNLVPFEREVPLTEAVLAEPLAVAIHAVDRVGSVKDLTVLVIGAGPIGVLTGLVAASRGARVLISEPHPVRRALAGELGLEALEPGNALVDEVATQTDGTMSDVVFDCAAYPPLTSQLSALARERGSIVLVALYSKPATLDLHALTFAEQMLLGSRVYTPSDLVSAVGEIESGHLGLSRLPLMVFGLDQVSGAVDAARQGAAMKIAVNPTTISEDATSTH
jgi:(R,R)-butanediol dehydrogenase/meso-butanediol dehydrogenase/diacetyl reductase